jgi:uncharacterized repeat protein (TIGR02543 family)
MNSEHTFRTSPAILAASVLLLILMSFAVSVPAQAFQIVHVVTFFENASANDSVTSSEMDNTAEQLTPIQDMNPSFSDVGYTFEDWNTSADGSGVAYLDGASYPFTADVALYAQWLPIPIVHDVTFFENSNASDSVVALEADSSPQSLTLVRNMNPSFSNAGYTFDGWNTSANGGGTSYADGSIFSFNSDISLYAQWTLIADVHDVTFFENDSATDSVSSDLSGSGPTQLTTFVGLQPSFNNPGHSFSGWNTSANGGGTAYADGSTYSFGSDISLYAQWVANVVSHTVTFIENDEISDAVHTSMSESATSSLTLFSNLQPAFVDSSHSFLGWNTSADGSGVSYPDGAEYSFVADLTLYAQWSPMTMLHTVTFNENDSATDLVNVIMTDSAPSALTLFANLKPIFQNGSLSFSGWNSSRDGTGTTYSDGMQYAFASNLVLYAQWTETSVETISFSANGGSGAIAPVSGLAGSTISIPNQSGFIRAGFVLTDWNSKANGSGTRYVFGEKVLIPKTTVLYAQWSGHKLATLFGAVGTFKSGFSSLSASLRSQINRIALTIKSRKYVKVDLFGYSATTGLKSLNISLSRDRARNVATYLINRLHELKVHGVSVSSSGEGSIAGQSSREYSRVEVFGV